MSIDTLSRAAAIVAIAVLAAGCGSSSNPTTTPSVTPSQSTAHSPTHSSIQGSSAPEPAPTEPSTPHATEFNLPGDIPDDAVFVDHTAPGSSVHFTVPEGWARSTQGGLTTFTDKYNSVSIEVRRRASAPTVASAGKQDVPELRRTVSNFAPGEITRVTRLHGPAVHLAFLMDSEPNPVTGKVVRDAVERFDFWHSGEEAVLTLAGPENADNVDPWQIVSDSLQWK